MNSLIGAIVALALMSLVAQPAYAQQSEVNSILSSIVAKTRDIGNVCKSRRPTYYCSFLESASLRAGKLRVKREKAWNNAGDGDHVEYDEVEIDLQSVYPTVERFPLGFHPLILVCKRGDCIDHPTRDGKQVRRDYYAVASSSSEEILRLFERLIALCSEASC